VRNENGQFVLYDLSGAGRTYLNGHPLQSGRALEPGDEVGIGGSTFIFRRLQLSPQRPPPFRPQ
jgi:pSer/pThr/pTyr-binding forkhead associated (FHA) protein